MHPLLYFTCIQICSIHNLNCKLLQNVRVEINVIVKLNPKLNLLIFPDLFQLHMILEKCSEDSFQCLIRGATFAHMKAVDMSSTYEHQILLYACRDWLNYRSIISRLLMSLLKMLKFFLVVRDLESWEHAKNQL